MKRRRLLIFCLFAVLLLFAVNTVQSYRYSMLRQRIGSLETAQTQAFEDNKSKLIDLTRERSHSREELLRYAEQLHLDIHTAEQIILLERENE